MARLKKVTGILGGCPPGPCRETPAEFRARMWADRALWIESGFWSGRKRRHIDLRGLGLLIGAFQSSAVKTLRWPRTKEER